MIAAGLSRASYCGECQLLATAESSEGGNLQPWIRHPINGRPAEFTSQVSQAKSRLVNLVSVRNCKNCLVLFEMLLCSRC